MRREPLLDKAILEDLYFVQHLSLARIAELTQTNYRWVRDSFRAHGLRWRTKREAVSCRPPMGQETRRKIAAARTGTKDSPDTAARKRATLARVGAWMTTVPADDPRRVRQREAAAAAMRRPDVRDACSIKKTQQIQSGTYYARGYHESPKAGRVYYMSGWELRRFQELDHDPQVISYRVQPCAVPYEWHGEPHRYTPDLLIQYADGSTVLEEIKPWKIVTQDRIRQGRITARLEAGQKYAAGQGWGWRIFSYPGR